MFGVSRKFVLAVAAACCWAYSASAYVMSIDLGSEYMKVALVQPGKAFEVVTNIHSKRKTPMSIGFYKGERLFSTDAENIGTRKPQFVIHSPHTLLGKSFDDPAVAAYVKDNYLPFEVEKSANGGVAFKLSASDDSFPDGRSFTAEELTAMFLSYAKHFSSLFAGGAEIMDTVLTVPAHYTQQNRLALLDAASLAGLRVLSLVDENTAAGVQYGLDKLFTNTTHTVLMYNGGASGVQVSVIEYSSYKPKGFGKKRVGQGAVLGSCWETGVGSTALTHVVMNQIAEIVNKKHGAALSGDVRTLRRPVAKLFKAARKTKEVLSANANYMLYLESLTPDVDFSSNIMRADFEEAAADSFAAAMKPVACAMQRANRTLDQIDQVEIIGGGVRTPAVQNLLTELLGGNMTLGVHLNGDEAMALGGAFMGANRSTSFRVRPVGMVATLPFAVEAELRNLNEDADAEEPWSKTSVMFKENNKLGNLKKLSFKQSKDLSVSLTYSADSPLPQGAQRALGKFAITGIEEAVAKYAELEEPKVSVTFSLDHNGVASVLRAEATFEEWANAGDAAAAAAADAADAAKQSNDTAAADADAESDEGAADDAKKADASDAEGAAADKEGDAAKEDDEAKEGDAKDGDATEDATAATATPEPTPLPKPKRKLHRVRLTVTQDVSELPVRPLTEEELAASKAVLAELQAVDDERAARAAAKSSLESYIYASRGKMGELYEEVEAISTEEQRAAISASLEEVEEWLYDEGDDTDVPTYTAKHDGLTALVQPVLTRVHEAAVRSKVTKQAQDFIAATKANLADWNESRPWLSDAQLELPTAAVDRFESWLTNVTATQAEQDPTQDPVFTEAQVKAKKNSIRGQMNYLKRIPKPTPTPKPSPPADKDAKKGKKDKDSAEDAEKSAEESAEDAAKEEAAAAEEGAKEEASGETAEEGGSGNAQPEGGEPAADGDAASSSTSSEDEL